MTEINTSWNLANIDHSWVKRNQDQIQSHEAWNEKLLEKDAENIMKDKEPYTFILRKGENKNSYFISYVKEDLSIKHQGFVLELNRKGWFYRNGVTSGLAEILETDLYKLIPQMMHCDQSACKPLAS